jgi:hypothetical protein
MENESGYVSIFFRIRVPPERIFVQQNEKEPLGTLLLDRTIVNVRQ